MPNARVQMARPLPDPHKIYIHAVRFLFTECRLRETSVGDQTTQDWVMMPAMVLSAFSAELFLKCLLILDGQRPPDVHHLRTLFELLHPQRKVRIEELWDKSVAANVHEFENTERLLDIKIPRDLKTALSDCGNAFDGLRYVYEDPSKVKFYIIDFARIVRTVILEFRPDWHSSTNSPRSPHADSA